MAFRVSCVLLLAFSTVSCSHRMPAQYDYQRNGWLTYELERPLESRSLSGVVTDPSGAPVPNVLVERVTPDWKNRIAARLTDGKGRFSFGRVRSGQYYLRVRKPEFFNTPLIKVIVHRRYKTDLAIGLEASN